MQRSRGLSGWRALVPLPSDLFVICAQNDSVVNLLERVTAPEAVKAIFLTYVPFQSLIYHQNGARLSGMFDRANLPSSKQSIRDTIKATGFWLR